MGNRSKKNIAILIVAVIIVAVIIVVGVPFAINELYIREPIYITLWDAGDVLIYFGSVLSALGATFLGIVAIRQNDKASKISDRLLKMEEYREVPFLKIDLENSAIRKFEESLIILFLDFKNKTNRVVEILKISEIEVSGNGLHGFNIYLNPNEQEFSSVVQEQTRRISFCNRYDIENGNIFEMEEIQALVDCPLTCKLFFEIRYFKSNIIYKQYMKFNIKNVPIHGFDGQKILSRLEIDHVYSNYEIYEL